MRACRCGIRRRSTGQSRISPNFYVLGLCGIVSHVSVGAAIYGQRQRMHALQHRMKSSKTKASDVASFVHVFNLFRVEIRKLDGAVQ